MQQKKTQNCYLYIQNVPVRDSDFFFFLDKINLLEEILYTEDLSPHTNWLKILWQT